MGVVRQKPDVVGDAPGAGPQTVAQHGLPDIPVGRLASWWHADADVGRTPECFTAVTTSRTPGFTAHQSTPHRFSTCSTDGAPAR